jgi:membrane protein DedA with SNARE-associated domain
MFEIIGTVSSWVLTVIGGAGYIGVSALMFLSAANVPIPSEVIMPFAGFAAFRGDMDILGVIIAGVMGGFSGSVASFFLGRKLGPRSLDIVSKISLHGKNDFLKTEKWFSRFGSWVVLFGLSMPIIRSFISLPAGIFGVRPRSFLITSFISISVWSAALALLGFFLGDNWTIVGSYFKKFDVLIVSLIVVFGAVWLVRHLKIKKT